MIWDYIYMWILGIIKFSVSLLLHNSLLYLGLPLYAFSYLFPIQFINTQKSEIKRMTTERTCKIILQSYVRSMITSRIERVEVIFSTQDNFGFKLHGFVSTWLPYSFLFEAFIYRYIEELSFILLYTFATFFFACFWQYLLSFGIKFEEILYPHHSSNKGHFK